MNTLAHNFIQAWIAFDCLCNVLVSTITGQQAYATETLSAHAWRARSKPFGRFFMPIIDVLFSWQKPDPLYLDEQGVPIKAHCRRAFLKERDRAYLPDVYRNPA